MSSERKAVDDFRDELAGCIPAICRKGEEVCPALGRIIIVNSRGFEDLAESRRGTHTGFTKAALRVIAKHCSLGVTEETGSEGEVLVCQAGIKSVDAQPTTNEPAIVRLTS